MAGISSAVLLAAMASPLATPASAQVITKSGGDGGSLSSAGTTGGAGGLIGGGGGAGNSGNGGRAAANEGDAAQNGGGGGGVAGSPPLTGGGGGGGGGGGDGGSGHPLDVAPVGNQAGGNGDDATGGGGGGGGGGGLTLLHGGSVMIDAGSAVAGGRGGFATIGGGGDGGGGGGGVFLVNGGMLNNSGAITGGAGGISPDGNGGGGGGGVLGNGAEIDNSGTITGGSGTDGGGGGNGAALYGGSLVNQPTGTITGGAGGFLNGPPSGDGAAAVLFRDDAVASLRNFGTLTGGNGGGNGGGGTLGQGGAGIQGAATGGISIINAGTIAGGIGGLTGGGAGGVQANAINLYGSDNRLELQSGYGFTGNVVVAGGGSNNVLALGGATNSSFDVSQIDAAKLYQGFTAFEKTGASTWVLTGTGTYTGGTTLRDGVLSISSDANLGASSGALTFNGGTLQATTIITTARNIVLDAGGGTFQTDNLLTANGIISGTGALHKNGTSTLVLTRANTYTGGTTVSQGAITAAVTGALGTGPVTINSAGRMSFTNATKADALSITNIGGINFRNTSSAGTAIIMNTGGTSFNDASNAGSAVIVNSGAGSADFYDTASAGNATITNNGSGFVRFVGNNTADGATVVNTGGYVNIAGLTSAGIAIGSLSGDGNVSLGSKTLTLGGLGKDDTIDGEIDGIFGGGLVKAGTGRLSLNGLNTYTGATDVNAGTLSVNGSIAFSALTTVNAGGTLGGNGRVGDTVINAGGTLSPGNSIGALTVRGNLVMATASTYLVEVSPTNADFTHVNGSANLGGATLAAHYENGSYVSKRYTVLTADGGLSGVFSGPVNTNLPSNFTSSLAYDGNNAWLDLVLNYATVPGFGGGLSVNQQNVANTLMNFYNSTGGIPLAFGALSPQGLTQASGEAATGSQQATFSAMNLFLGVLTDPFIAGRGNNSGQGGDAHDAFAAMPRKAPGALSQPGFEQRWSVWSAAYGGSQTTSGNAAAGTNTATSNLYGIAVGADYRLSPDTLAGFAMAGGGTTFRTGNGLGAGRSDLFQVGGFIRHHIGNAYLSGALAYGWQDVTTDRTVAAAGIEQLNARFNSHAFSGRLEGGYRIATPLLGLTPYIAGQFTRYDLPGYAEQGAGLFALNYAARDVTAIRSEFGIRTDKSFALQDAELTLRGRAAWAHNFDTDRAIGAAFQALPGTSFTVNGAAQASEAALVTTAAEVKWTNGFALAASFEGEFSDTTESYAGKGVVRYTW